MTSHEPDPVCLPAVRSQCEQALEHLRNACQTFRQHGWPENADELMRTFRHLQVWTQKDGWLDWLEKEDEPGDAGHASSGKGTRR